MIMVMMLEDAWRHGDEGDDQKYDMSTAADSWQEEQYHGYGDNHDDDDKWHDGWQHEHHDDDDADDAWNNREEEASDWRPTDDLAAGAADNYDNSWTTDYNDSFNTADDNYNNDY